MEKRYKVIIIDDEELARSLVIRYVEAYSMLDIVATCSNGFEGLKAIEEHQPDLVFLDIQMPKLTGFEMLELVEKQPLVVFTTAYDAFAIKAFEENAIDYLLKPFSSDRFDKSIQKALDLLALKTPLPKIGEEIQLQKEGLDRIAIKQGSKIHIFSTEHVFYIESNGDYVLIHTNEGRFIKEKTMKYYETNLDSRSFVRIHRSYIVNVNYIQRIENFEKDSHVVILKNDVRLKVSAEGYKLLRKSWG
jgi:two-component system, LytTR family, response regulator